MKSLTIRTQKCRSVCARGAYVIVLTALFSAAPFHAALAQTAPTLGAAQSFAVLGATTVTNTGPTIITGDLGVSPGTAVTGFPPGIMNGGATHAADAVALQAQNATTAAYINLAGQKCPVSNTFGVPTDLAGMTLVPGVYCFASSAGLTGTLILDALGNPDAVWVFQIASTLITGVNSRVAIINGGQPCNVFWQVGSSATLNVGTTFIGDILALTSIALQTNADVSGRALARNGAVTMDTNTVAFTACTVQPVTPFPPTLSKDFSPATITAGGASTLTITLSNADGTVASSASLTDTLPLGVVVNGSASTTCGGTVSAGTSSVTLTGGSIPANGSCTVTVPVAAASAGSYINSLVAGALQTSNGSNAATADATLTVLLPGNNAPGLSLNKTADRTTYTSVGQVIVYTYVVRNIGQVNLTDPFTVTDDKLGSFACGLSTTILAPGDSVTCTRNYTIKAGDLGNATSLPTGGIANINTGLWLQGVVSTQDTTITGAGPGVPNGIYPGWCIQDHVPTDLHNQPARLYSTVGGGLPADVAGLAWNKVNYALNHKIRGPGKTRLAFFQDVQTAVWVLLGERNPEFGVSAAAQQMIDEANAQASFVPGPYDVVAVIVYSDGIRVPIRPGEVQESIIEVQPLKAIVNHATGSVTFGGVVVRSGQVEATVKQVR